LPVILPPLLTTLPSVLDAVAPDILPYIAFGTKEQKAMKNNTYFG
jgi:hypothetical protein